MLYIAAAARNGESSYEAVSMHGEVRSALNETNHCLNDVSVERRGDVSGRSEPSDVHSGACGGRATFSASEADRHSQRLCRWTPQLHNTKRHQALNTAGRWRVVHCTDLYMSTVSFGVD